MLILGRSPRWILLLAVLAFVWPYLVPEAWLGDLGAPGSGAITPGEATLSLLVLYGFASQHWVTFSGVGRYGRGLALFAVYVLHVAVFVWSSIAPARVAVDTEPLFHLFTIGILPPSVYVAVRRFGGRRGLGGAR